MVALSREEELALGLTPPVEGEAPVDPKTKIRLLPKVERNLFRQRLNLSEEKLAKIKKVLDNACADWAASSSSLMSKLRRITELTSGIKSPKSFPWNNSSNLHIPLIEIHTGILWSSVESTVLRNSPIWNVKKEIKTGVEDAVDMEISDFLSSVSKEELKLDRAMSEAYYNAFRDPLAIGHMEWVEELAKRFDIKVFNTVEEFQAVYPSPEEAGVSESTYGSIIEMLLDGESVHLKVEEEYAKYRGPKLRIIELKDMIIYPATSRSFDYAQFVGDYAIEREAYFTKGIKYKWFDKKETEEMLKHPDGSTGVDTVTQAQDRIEGLSRNKDTSKEYRYAQGVLKIDLDDDGEEEMYGVIFHPKSKRLIRIEQFPYWHNRMNYIGFKVKRKTNRLLGECVYDWLYDLNEEVDTQHNQRIDSRTITLVPSFKKKTSAMFDPTRKDQKFYPGVTFTVNSQDDIQQFDIKQTDMGQSMQEEGNLMQIAEFRTGGSMLRSGAQTPRDPRAPAKKVMALLSQSSIRIDPYIEELKEGTNEVGRQAMALYYQFAPEKIMYPHFDPEVGKWLAREIERSRLRYHSMTIDIARSSIDDNPEATAQKKLVEYQILLRNPLFANNIFRLHVLSRELVLSLRKKDANILVPPIEQFVKEMQMQEQVVGPGAGVPGLLNNIMGGKPGAGNEPSGMRQGGPELTPQSVVESPSA